MIGQSAHSMHIKRHRMAGGGRCSPAEAAVMLRLTLPRALARNRHLRTDGHERMLALGALDAVPRCVLITHLAPLLLLAGEVRQLAAGSAEHGYGEG